MPAMIGASTMNNNFSDNWSEFFFAASITKRTRPGQRRNENRFDKLFENKKAP